MRPGTAITLVIVLLVVAGIAMIALPPLVAMGEGEIKWAFLIPTIVSGLFLLALGCILNVLAEMHNTLTDFKDMIMFQSQKREGVETEAAKN